MITQEDRQYYDDMASMFGEPGWQRLMDEAKKQIYQFQADALEATRIEEVFYLRGQAEQLVRLINLPDTLATIKAQAEAADEPDVVIG